MELINLALILAAAGVIFAIFDIMMTRRELRPIGKEIVGAVQREGETTRKVLSEEIASTLKEIRDLLKRWTQD